MKRFPLLMAAALVPLAASAGEKDLVNWDVESVKDDQRITDIIGAEVYTSDGKEIGEVRDVVLDGDGISAVLFMPNARAEMTSGKRVTTPADPQDTDVYESAEAAARDNMADAPNVRQEPASSDDFQEQQSDTLMRTTAQAGIGEMAMLDWDDVTYDVGRDAVLLKSDAVHFESAAAFDADRNRGMAGGERASDKRDASQRGDEVPANTVLGMDVNLADEESFGRVEDVLVSDNGEATAFVVDSWDLVDKQRFAIPADITTVNAEQNEINLDYSKDQLTNLEEFDFDDLDSNQ